MLSNTFSIACVFRLSLTKNHLADKNATTQSAVTEFSLRHQNIQKSRQPALSGFFCSRIGLSYAKPTPSCMEIVTAALSKFDRVADFFHG